MISVSGVPVDLRVGGQTYRVVSSAPTEDLERLAERVDEAVRAVIPRGRQASDQSFVLAAMHLAHELGEKERELAKLEERYREKLRELLSGVDQALALVGVRPEADATLAPSEAEQAPAEVYALRKSGRSSARYER